MRQLDEKTMASILEGNTESLTLEFKESFDFKDVNSLWMRDCLIRAILAMSNTRTGGQVVIGIKEKNNRFKFVGMKKIHLLRLSEDDLKTKVEFFSNSPVDYDVHVGSYKRKKFVVITVREFSRYPSICKNNGESKTENGKPKNVLEIGTIYIRTIKEKPSSVKLLDPSDVQDFVERAALKQIDSWHKVGLKHESEILPDAKTFFETERNDF